MIRLIACLALLAASLCAQTPPKAFAALTGVSTTAAYAVGGNDKHTVQLVMTGSPASCTANLDGSLDGTHWKDLSGGQTCTSTPVIFHVVDRVVAFVRINVTALSGGATVTPTYQGLRSGSR